MSFQIFQMKQTPRKIKSKAAKVSKLLTKKEIVKKDTETNVVAAIVWKRAAKVVTHLQLKVAIFASLQK